MEDWKEIVSNDIRYKNFKILDEPQCFSDMYKDRDFETVDVHSVYVISNTQILGFCGSFQWKNGYVIPCDGDTYNREMLVLGYEYDERVDVLDILVGNDW